MTIKPSYRYSRQPVKHRYPKKVFEPVVRSYRTGSKRERRTVGFVAMVLGYSCQYFYKHCKEQENRILRELQVKHLVDKERKLLARLGGRKLHHQIRDSLQAQEIKFGRDRLFALLKKHHMLILPKRRYVQTTMSKHWLRKYPNLVKDIAISRPDEVWVSDITYLKTDEGTTI